MSLNIVMGMGNLTRDPDLKFTPKGTAVCQFSIAINRKWRTANNEDMEETTFVDCRAWGRTAEVIAAEFYKGRPIFVNGRLKQEEWTDKQTGEKRKRMLVEVESFEFCGGERRQQQQSQPQQQQQRGQAPTTAGRPANTRPPSQTSATKPDNYDDPIPEDEIPF